jgi:hypothetical protein
MPLPSDRFLRLQLVMQRTGLSPRDNLSKGSGQNLSAVAKARIQLRRLVRVRDR